MRGSKEKEGEKGETREDEGWGYEKREGWIRQEGGGRREGGEIKRG